MPQSTRAGSQMDDLVDKGAEQFKKVADRVEGIATGVSDQMREASDSTGKVAGNLKKAVDKSVKAEPMATLAMAAAAGFVLGALWKS